jgi:hypothetical protein
LSTKLSRNFVHETCSKFLENSVLGILDGVEKRTSMSNDGSTESSKQHHSGGGDVPLILTTQQREEADEKRERKAEVEAARVHRENDEAYKDRQLTLTEAANRLSRRNLVFTSILALFTIIGATAAIWQGIIAARNAHSAEIAAHAAQCAAVTANSTLQEMKADALNTLNQTRDTTHLDQRAWVSLSQLEVVPTDSGHAVKGFVINSGKTPANEVRTAAGVYARYGGSEYLTPSEGDYDWIKYILRRTWNKEITQTTFLWAATEIKPQYYGRKPPNLSRRDWVGAPKLASMGDLPPGPNQYNFPFPDLLKNAGAFFPTLFYGEIRYDDYIGKEHTTKFCYLLPAGVSKAEPVNPCEKGNEME